MKLLVLSHPGIELATLRYFPAYIYQPILSATRSNTGHYTCAMGGRQVKTFIDGAAGPMLYCLPL